MVGGRPRPRFRTAAASRHVGSSPRAGGGVGPPLHLDAFCERARGNLSRGGGRKRVVAVAPVGSMSRLKVLHAAKFYPPVRGGMETVVGDLCHGTVGEWDVR